MDKKAMSKVSKQFWAILVVLAVILVVVYKPDFSTMFSQKPALSAATATNPAQVAATTPVKASQCPSTGTTTDAFQIRDVGASSFTILGSLTTKFVGTTGTVTATSNTGSTSATFNSSATLNCGDTYTAYVLPSATANGAKGIAQFMSSPAAQTDITTKASSGLQATVYDNTNAVFARTGGATTFTAISATWNESAVGGTQTLFNISTVTDLDVTVNYKTVTADTTYQGAEGDCIWAIDANANEFTRPDFGGLQVKLLSEAGLSSNTITALTGFEYVAVGAKPATSSATAQKMYFKALAGIDPTSDIRVKLICKDYYVSNYDANKVLYDYFTDAPSPAQVGNGGTAEQITFDNM